MSISDTARQVMLVAHGQWDPSHGNVKFPKDVRVIHFYAVHEEYGKIAAAYAVLDAQPANAYRGLADPVSGVTARSVVDLSGDTKVANYDLGWPYQVIHCCHVDTSRRRDGRWDCWRPRSIAATPNAARSIVAARVLAPRG